MTKLIIVVFTVIISSYSNLLANRVLVDEAVHKIAKEETDASHDHEHRFEVGISAGPTFFIAEKNVALGLHLHVLHNFIPSDISVGLGVEKIFDEHNHTSLGLVLGYNILENLYMGVSPALTIEENELIFSGHLEAVYGIEMGDFHIGPAVEFAFDGDDYHCGLGLHIGLGL